MYLSLRIFPLCSAVVFCVGLISLYEDDEVGRCDTAEDGSPPEYASPSPLTTCLLCRLHSCHAVTGDASKQLFRFFLCAPPSSASRKQSTPAVPSQFSRPFSTFSNLLPLQFQCPLAILSTSLFLNVHDHCISSPLLIYPGIDFSRSSQCLRIP